MSLQFAVPDYQDYLSAQRRLWKFLLIYEYLFFMQIL